VVLDPFAGSGTTVKVAQDLGRVGVGVDLKPDYLQMARKRSAQQGLQLT
jgi:site-specific DNA-methyltransferase (adenine-specific)/site-specific DNA-methyltransferase (cytosine-N4-specific)